MVSKHPNIVNVAALEGRTQSKGTRFGAESKRLGTAAGGQQLGCSWYKVPPGRSAFPHHFHCANEEAVFILSGQGEVRIGDEKAPVTAGDYIALPIGPQHAHSLVNTGEADLTYLCFSTMHATEVVGYPDSNKLAAVGAAKISGGLMSSPNVWLRTLIKQQPSVDYYEDENTGE